MMSCESFTSFKICSSADDLGATVDPVKTMRVEGIMLNDTLMKVTRSDSTTVCEYK